MNLNQHEIFISWSGTDGERIAQLIYEWMRHTYDEASQKVLLSPEIKIGKVSMDEIINALNSCNKGIFIITRERAESPWINFEAGAIFKGDKEKDIIPVYVDISHEEITNAPVSLFKSRISFTYDDIHSLICTVGSDLKWNFKTSYNYAETTAYFKKEIDKINEDLKQDSIMKKVYQNCEQYAKCYSYRDTGCVAHLDENSFFDIRKSAVKEAMGELIIAGPSLTEAIGSSARNNRSLRSIIQESIKGKRITSLHVMITDLAIFEKYFSESNEATTRVMSSLNAIRTDLLSVCNEYKCDINIYFLPLYDMDHVVLTNEYMLYRATKLWTHNAEYKGEFLLYRNIGEQSEYTIQYSYLKTLMQLCTRINFDIDTEENDSDTFITKENKQWRRSIKNNGYEICEKRLGELKYIHLYKLYDSQLKHYIACDWKGPNYSELCFTGGKFIKNQEDLFKSENLLNDSTQKYLLPYVKETETLLKGVVEKYGTAEIYGERISDAKIYPSLELGFPNNAVRLAGGFATGMLVTWKCGTPIVPVDATVNVCSSSVFELPDDYNMDQTDEEFVAEIQNLIRKANEAGYAFNFASGNHFLMIAEDEEEKKYLVLHSSAKEFKDSYIGLYPTEQNWYSDKIRTYPTPYIQGERYIRYIKGDDAAFFISLSKKLEKMNEQIHAYFAGKMKAKHTNLLSRPTYHHYYMPTDSSIAIGTFVEEPGTVVPVFSIPKKEICLFKIQKKQNWTIQLGGKKKCLVPHGWGQSIDGELDISVDYVEKELSIKVDETEYKHDLNTDKHIKCENKKIREYESCHEFFKNQKYVNGEIIRILKPKFLFCSEIKGRVE